MALRLHPKQKEVMETVASQGSKYQWLEELPLEGSSRYSRQITDTLLPALRPESRNLAGSPEEYETLPTEGPLKGVVESLNSLSPKEYIIGNY
jgi:hypothetical protein